MELFQNRFDLFRHRQTQMCRIFQKAYALVGDVEKDNGCAQYRAATDHLHIQHIGNAHKQKNQNLAADALKSNCARQLLICHSAHHACDIINDRKGNKCIEQTIAAAEEVP